MATKYLIMYLQNVRRLCSTCEKVVPGGDCYRHTNPPSPPQTAWYFITLPRRPQRPEHSTTRKRYVAQPETRLEASSHELAARRVKGAAYHLRNDRTYGFNHLLCEEKPTGECFAGVSTVSIFRSKTLCLWLLSCLVQGRRQASTPSTSPLA